MMKSYQIYDTFIHFNEAGKVLPTLSSFFSDLFRKAWDLSWSYFCKFEWESHKFVIGFLFYFCAKRVLLDTFFPFYITSCEFLFPIIDFCRASCQLFSLFTECPPGVAMPMCSEDVLLRLMNFVKRSMRPGLELDGSDIFMYVNKLGRIKYPIGIRLGRILFKMGRILSDIRPLF